MKNLMLLGVLLLFMLTGCDPEELSADPLVLQMSQEAGSALFEITSNTNWNIENNAEWLVVNPAEGVDNEMITVTCNKNTDYQKRSAPLTISGVEKEVIVTVSQEARTGIQMNWVQKADMPTARNFISPNSCVLDGEIYVIGGASAEGDVLNVVEAYNPVMDSWTTKAPLLKGRWGHIVEQVGGKIYVMGGCLTISGDAINDIEVYDPVNNEWTFLGQMPEVRLGFVTCLAEDKIYVMGGRNAEPGGDYYSSVYSYDPSGNNWVSKSPLPVPNAYMGAALAEGIIYAIGGVNIGGAGTAVNTSYKYDLATDTWSVGPELLTGRWGLISCNVDSLIVCAAGYTGPTDNGKRSVEIMNVHSGTVAPSSSLLFSASTGSICQLDGKIYVFGGATTSPPDYGASNRVQEGSFIFP